MDTSNEPLLPPHTRQATAAILVLLFFSTLMFSLPFGVFFGIQHVLKVYFDITGFQNTVASVLGAVVTVNLIIVAYVYYAYKEQEYDDQGNKIDTLNVGTKIVPNKPESKKRK